MVDLSEFESLAAGLRGQVSDYAVETFESLYRNGEYQLALEELCDKVDDAEERIPEAQVPLLRSLGLRFRVDRMSFLALTSIAAEDG